MRAAVFLMIAFCCFAQLRQQPAMSPANLAALSGAVRGELQAGQYSKALSDAEQLERMVRAALSGSKLDSEPNLPLALGASYEVQAQALAALQRRSEALQLLQTAERDWRGTSIISRLQKNILLLTLDGHPLPEVRGLANSLHGKTVLLFFWAHWCADCKADAPVIATLAREFEPKGLTVIAPTRLYGYTAQEENASAFSERIFIGKVFDRFYSMIPNVAVPIDGTNFDRFGASTTPTLVVADTEGIVRLYHPGYMDEQSLRGAIESAMVRKRTSENMGRRTYE